LTGVTVIRIAEFRTEPLSVDEVRTAVADPSAGAIALFVGTVRDHDHGRAVSELSYSAHPTGENQLREVAEKVAARFTVRALAAVHRTGDLDIGDLAVVVAAASDHRDEAFAACRALIEDIKHSVPVWKHQRFAGGDSEWVNSA
jgi:molybdopterin synthase catalytic subunit